MPEVPDILRSPHKAYLVIYLWALNLGYTEKVPKIDAQNHRAPFDLSIEASSSSELIC